MFATEPLEVIKTTCQSAGASFRFIFVARFFGSTAQSANLKNDNQVVMDVIRLIVNRSLDQ